MSGCVFGGVVGCVYVMVVCVQYDCSHPAWVRASCVSGCGRPRRAREKILRVVVTVVSTSGLNWVRV